MPDDTEAFFLNLAVQRGLASREVARECMEASSRSGGRSNVFALLAERARIPTDAARALHAEAVSMARGARGPDVQQYVSSSGSSHGHASSAGGAPAAAFGASPGGSAFGASPGGSVAGAAFGASPGGSVAVASGFGASPGGSAVVPAFGASPGASGAGRPTRAGAAWPPTQADAHTPGAGGSLAPSHAGSLGPPTGSAAGYRIPTAFQPGEQFGRYRLERELGRGGMGVVWRARQVDLDRPVAIKMLLQGAAADDRRRNRFLTEARTVARLAHPNLVGIHDVGELDGVLFFTMELVDGPSLGDLLKQTPRLEVARALEIAIGIGHGLAEAHGQQLVHRDLKPANVLIDPRGVARITDFGIAKDLTSQGNTVTGEVLGTPAYMPPEQASGKAGAVDARADIYSLGAILYRMLVGKPPFDGTTPYDVISKVLAEQPVPPRKLDRTIPRDLDEIVMRCLAKPREERFESAAALVAALEAARARLGAASGEGGAGAPPPAAGLGLVGKVVVATAAGLVVVAALVAAEGWRQLQQRNRDEQARLEREEEARQAAALEAERQRQRALLEEARELLAQAQKLAATDPAAAVARAREASALVPHDGGVLGGLGRLLLTAGGDAGAACEVLDRAVRMVPDDVEARAARALCLVALDRPPTEVEADAVKLELGGPRGRALAASVRAEGALRHEDVAVALVHLDDAAQHDPKDARLRLRLAQVLLQGKRYASAEDEATAAYDLDRGLVEALRVRAHARLRRDKPAEALADAQALLAARPGDAEAERIAAEARQKARPQAPQPPPRPPVGPVDHAAHDHIHAALDAFTAALKPKGAGPEEAKRQLELAYATVDVPCPKALLDRARAATRVRAWQLAAQDLERYRTLAKDKLELGFLLLAAEVLEQGLKKVEEAAKYLDLAARMAPDSVDVIDARGRFLERNGRPEDALAEWDRGVKARPDDHWLRHERGHFYHRAGKQPRDPERLALALADLDWAVEREAKAHYLLTRAEILADLGRADDARRDLDAARTKPDASEAEVERVEKRLAEGP